MEERGRVLGEVEEEVQGPQAQTSGPFSSALYGSDLR